MLACGQQSQLANQSKRRFLLVVVHLDILHTALLFWIFQQKMDPHPKAGLYAETDVIYEEVIKRFITYTRNSQGEQRGTADSSLLE